MRDWRLKTSENIKKIIRCWNRWDKNLIRFLARLAWLIIGTHVLFAGVYYYTTLSTPPLPSIEKRIYEHHNRKYEDRDGESVSVEAKDKSANIASTKEQETPGNDQKLKDLQEYIRSARDLNAQEGMWRAANFLAVLTAVQVVFGALALWFIYDTLLATRRTLSETQNATIAANRAADAAESSERAHVFPEASFIDKHAPRNDMKTLQIRITNFGKTPALAVYWRIMWTDGEKKSSSQGKIIDILPEKGSVSIVELSKMTQYNTEITDQAIVEIVEYIDVFQKKQMGVQVLVNAYGDLSVGTMPVITDDASNKNAWQERKNN